jgi:hypothetical protein
MSIYLYLLLTLFILTFILLYNSKKRQDKHDDSIFINIEDTYTINYRSYPNIDRNIKINKIELKIFDALNKGIPLNYTIRVVGGWIRDKVLYIYSNY